MSELKRLVNFVGEETELVSRVEEAVEWVFSKPEGRDMLEKAYKLHKNPLKIITDSTVHNLGYGDLDGNHVVYVNPELIDLQVLNGKSGEKIQATLERFFSHEFLHSTQPDVILNAQNMLARKQEIQNEVLPQIPFEQYQQRIMDASNSDVALAELLGEIYDTHIADSAAELTRTMINRFANDEIIKKFTDKYETPAIEFENLMMEKYLREQRWY
ncbi:MAG: hypothetical protein WCJ33_05690 [Pseudomonadota bacterium]